MPLLITKKQLCEEIIKIKGPQFSNLEMSSNDVYTTIDVMLIWIQEICGTYGQLVEDFGTSFADGKSFLYLIDFYLPGYMPCSCLLKEPQDIDTLDEMTMNSSDTKASICQYSLVQDAIKHLYNIPEVLQMTDFLEGDPSCNERNVIILLTFLSSQLLEGKPMNKNWAHALKSSRGLDNYEKIVPDMHSGQMEHTTEERASIVIQSHYKGVIERRKFLKSKAAALLLQRAVRVRIAAAQKEKNIQKAQISAILIIQSHIRGWLQRSRYNLLVTKIRKIQSIYRVYKHRRSQIKAAVKIQCSWKRVLVQSKFSQLRNAVIKIQSFCRGWLARKYLDEHKAAAIVIQSWFRGYRCWKQYKLCIEALINIQRVIRGRVMLQTYVKYKNAACKLQRAFRVWLARKYVQKHGFETVGEECQLNGFAIVIQAAFRGCQERKKYKMKLRMARRIQAVFRGGQVRKTQSSKLPNKGLEYPERDCAPEDAHSLTKLTEINIIPEAAKTIQRFYRGHAARLLSFKSSKLPNKGLDYPERDCAPEDAHSLTKFTEINIITEAAKTIQRFYRGYAARLLSFKRRQYKFKTHDVNFPQEMTLAQTGTDNLLHDVYFSNYLNAGTDKVLRVRNSVLKLQRWWRNVSAHRSSSATVIQSHFRGWLGRKIFLRLKSHVLLIQACWRSHFVRKTQVDVRQQLSNLRFRMENSAANVDDNLRLENRLTKALEALLNHKTLSGIIHTCATLDTATQHSKRCCERLVAAGAIEKLLQLINETNRSAPHEEVLKHALSVLCNIAHYPELAQLVVNTPDSITQIAKQLWRNKEEGFSKAIEILKKLCAVKSGADVVQKLAPNVSRLQLLAQKIEKKVEMERRSLARLPQKGAGATRKPGERRLREAESQHRSIIHLLQCITGDSGRRRSEVHKIRCQSDHVLKRTSSGTTELPRCTSKGCIPFQDLSNH